MSERNALIAFLVTHPTALLQSDFLRELFMIPDRMIGLAVSDTHFDIQTLSPLYAGKLFVSGDQFYAISTFERTDDRNQPHKTYRVTAEPTHIPYDVKHVHPLCTPQDRFTLKAGDIPNYIGDPIYTTIGIYIANYMFFVYPFANPIPYYNDEFSTSEMEKRIVPLLFDKKVTVSEVKDKYANALSLHGSSCEIFCPNITEKAITIPQEIHDLRERLVAQHREALDAGDVSVMSDIEKQLITAYRKHLQGDPSMDFLLKKKYFDVTLKKLFLTHGMTEVFGSPGKFTFIDNPMGNGWKVDDLANIFNETRQGSYSRAIETADGGVIAKLILRVFQDTRITIPDCGTTRGEAVDNVPEILQDFIQSYVVLKDGTNSLITEQNTASFTGTVLTIRTPGYCQAEHGFCARCFGYLFEELGQEALSTVYNDFARMQTTSALKRMHGKSHSTVSISNLDKYLVGAG